MRGPYEARVQGMTTAKRCGAGDICRLSALAMGAVSVLLVFCSPAVGLTRPVFSGAFGAPGAGEGQFNGPFGVAVAEPSGNVYVARGAGQGRQLFTHDSAPPAGLRAPGQVRAAQAGALSPSKLGMPPSSGLYGHLGTQEDRFVRSRDGSCLTFLRAML